MSRVMQQRASSRLWTSLLVALSLLPFSACSGDAEAAGGPPIGELPTLLVTDALEGNIEPCGCGGNMSGGLEDSVRSVVRSRKDGEVWIDMGLAIGGGPLKSFVFDELVPQWKQGGVRCIGLGPDELVFVDQLRDASIAPLVCANFEAAGVDRFWETGGLRITSIVSPRLVPGFEVSAALPAMQLFFAEARAARRLPVVGLHAKDPERRRILSWLRGYEHRFLVFDTCSKDSAEQGVGRYGAGMVIRGRGRGRSHTRVEWDLDDENYWALINFVDARKTGSNAVAKSFRRRAAGAVVDDASLTDGFVGSQRCGSCHQAEYEQWLTTRHATAMQSLENVHKAGRADCYTCHITSAATDPGLALRALPRTSPDALAHVGCESCHGAGGEHVASRKPMTTVPESTCRSCHIGKFSDGFDYRKAIPAVTCQPQ